MIDMDKSFSAFCGVTCAVLSFCFGGADKMLAALIAMMALDYLSGVIYAATQRKLSSRIGFCGIARKMLMLIIVAAANLCDSYIIGDGSTLRSAAIGFYTANEALSLLENAALLRIPLPRRLISMFARLHEEEKDNKDKSDEKDGAKKSESKE